MSSEGQDMFVCIQALEDGVNVIGMTRGPETRPAHTERLNAGEVLLAQFTEKVSAMKIRGKAKIVTKFGELESGG